MDENPLTSRERKAFGRTVKFNIGSSTSAKGENYPEEVDSEPVEHEKGQLLNNEENDDKLIVELYDLEHKSENVDEWVERARWIKYEEDVEGFEKKFGAPHVAMLTFDTMIAIKQVLRKALLLTSVPAQNYSDLIENISFNMTKAGEDPILVQKVVRLMNLRRIHVVSRQITRNQTMASLPYNSSMSGNIANSVSLSRIEDADIQARYTTMSFKRVISVEEEVPKSAQIFVGQCGELTTTRLIFVRLEKAVVFPEVIDAPYPMKFLAFLLGPVGQLNYHEMGRGLCTMLANREFKHIAETAVTSDKLSLGVDSFLQRSVVLPPGEIDSKRLIPVDDIKKYFNNLEHHREMRMEISKLRGSIVEDMCETKISIKRPRRRRLFGGLCEDIRGRYPLYWSDIVDAFRSPYICFTSVSFMFLACIAPTLAFGGLMEQYSNGSMGLRETLLAQSLCGVIWGLVSTQPLVIVSATGPVLIFEASLYKICMILQIDFLSVRIYTGAGILALSLLTSMFDGQRLLVFVTRFTEDIFAALISIIFFSEGYHFLEHTFAMYPVNDVDYYVSWKVNCSRSTAESAFCGHIPHANTALLSFLVLVSTFALATTLKLIRQSTRFGRRFRVVVGDFGVAIALFIVITTVHLLFPQVFLEKLRIPATFANETKRGHGKLVFPKDIGIQGIAAGFAAAVPVFSLLFVETGITEVLLGRKDNKLAKSVGQSWDLLVIGMCAMLCSILGLPWMCAAAVQSLAHCGSLTIKAKRAPGQKDETVSVVEQRMTGIVIAILIGLVCYFGQYISIPMASLFGVFVYLGLMNLSGVSLIERIGLMSTPFKYWPKEAFVKLVSQRKIHLFTCIQLALVAIVYAVKLYKVTAIFFPVVLMTFIIFRHAVLNRVFTEEELIALDGDHEEESQSIDEDGDDYYGKVPIPV